MLSESQRSPWICMGEPTFHAEKTACCRLQQQTKVHVLDLVWLLSRTAQKALNKLGLQCTKSDNFTEHYIITLLSVYELVLLGRRLVLRYMCT